MFIPLYNRYTNKVRVEKIDQRRKINTARFSGSDSCGQVKLTAWSRDDDEQDDVAEMKYQLKKGVTYLVSGAAVKPVETTVYRRSTGGRSGRVSVHTTSYRFWLVRKSFLPSE